MAFALCTISSDTYISGTACMITSFLNKNDWFDGDIIVLHSKTLAPLSNTNKKFISSLYKNVKYKEVNEGDYSGVINHFKQKITPQKKIRILKFDAFSINGYERIMYSDSDMIFTGNVNEAFNVNSPLCIARDGFAGKIKTSVETTVKANVPMNHGLFVFSDSFVLKCYKPALIKYGERYNLSEFDAPLFDQSIMNRFFKNTVVSFLPSNYNLSRMLYSDARKECPVSDLKCIHYQTVKPWSSKKEDHTGFTKVEKYWFDVYDKLPKPISNTYPLNVPKSVKYEKPKSVAPVTKINTENYKIEYNTLNVKYALLTNYNNSTKNMINSFISKNKWFNGVIEILGKGNVSELQSIYKNIKFVDSYGSYDKVMYLSSEKMPSVNLYGLFVQNHGRVEYVKDNESIRLKNKDEVSDSSFYFINKNVNCDKVVLFPESYFNSLIEKKNDFLGENIIISMTSYKDRIGNVKNVLSSILKNTLPPDKIVINLSSDEFKSKNKDLPKSLLEFVKDNKIEINWVTKNTKQFKKIIPTLNKYPNDIIISVDDDLIYPKEFIETVYVDFLNCNKLHPITCGWWKSDNFYNGNYSHHGSFTLTMKRFYGTFLDDIYKNVVLPNLWKTINFDDPVYTYAALCNKVKYKTSTFNGRLYKKKFLKNGISSGNNTEALHIIEEDILKKYYSKNGK